MRLYVKLVGFVLTFVGLQWGIVNGFGGLAAADLWLDARAAWSMSYGTDVDREAAVEAYIERSVEECGVDRRVLLREALASEGG